jgi:imidazolonepropionase-like amidohydrolase
MTALLPLLSAALSCVATPCAFENARVEVGDGTVLEAATVVVAGGRIAAVGTEVEIPEAARRIDAEGKVITPGLIEVRSRLGLAEVLAVTDANDHALEGDVTPAFRAAEGFNPFSIWIPITREEGVTSAVTAPTGSLVYGQGYWFDLTGELGAAPRPDAPLAMFGGVGRRAASVAGGARGGVWLSLRSLIADARFYRENQRRFDAGQSRTLAAPPVHLEALLPVLDGSLPLVLDVDRASDILAALALAREENLRIVIFGGAEAWRVAPAIAEAGVPVVLVPSGQLPGSFDELHARDDAPALLEAAGVTVVLSAFGWHNNIRRLRQEAGLAVAFGLPRARALAAITSGPARLYGKDGEVGSLLPGRRANLVVWDGDPLEMTSTAETVLIDGIARATTNRQHRLAERYRARGAAASEAPPAEAPGTETDETGAP